jgi:ribosomal protein L35
MAPARKRRLRNEKGLTPGDADRMNRLLGRR